MADTRLFTLVSILIGISIILTYSLSVYTTLLFGVNEFYFVLRQLFFGFLSIIIMWLLAQQNPDKWLTPLCLTLFIGSAFLMMIMPFLGESLVSAVGGAKRWIKIFGFSLAPVEFFKIGFVYFLAWSFSRKLGHHDGIGLKREFIRFVPYAFVFIITMFIIAFVQNDLGQVVVLGLTLLFMTLFAGSSFRFFFSIFSRKTFIYVALCIRNNIFFIFLYFNSF